MATINILIYSQSAKVDKSLADEFKSNLQSPMKLIHVGIYTAIGVGALLVVATIHFLLLPPQTLFVVGVLFTRCPSVRL